MAEGRMTVGGVIGMIEGFAPPELAEPWDNAGLQIGALARAVSGVLVALDVTLAVVAEARALDCDMIVAHHPILFHGVNALPEDGPDGALVAALIRGGVSLYTCHTALDRAPGGVSDELAARIGLENVEAVGESGFVRAGDWRGGDCGALLDHIRGTLGVPGAILYGGGASRARRVGVCPGAGMDMLAEAGAVDAFVTGDVTHHRALNALAAGVAVVDVGHRGGELVAVDLLARGLQKAAAGVECPLRVHASRVDPYALVPG